MHDDGEQPGARCEGDEVVGHADEGTLRARVREDAQVPLGGGDGGEAVAEGEGDGLLACTTHTVPRRQWALG
jgi:hypothetical protein